MKVECAHDELVQIKDLKPFESNENAHSREQIERLAKILHYQGFRKPIIVSKRSGYVVTGHGTLEAATFNGWIDVPVSYQDFDSPEQEAAHRIADNGIQSWSQLDLSLVNIELGEMGPDFDPELLGIKGFELELADRPIKACPQCGFVKGGDIGN